MKERVLITGCCGFLAGYLIEQLAEKSVELTGISNNSEFNCDKIDYRCLDIRDREAVEMVVEEVKPHRIFHLAAVSNVGISWKQPDLTYGVNLIGSANVMNAAEKFCSKPLVVLMSSAELYGNLAGGTTDVAVNSPYALSKYAMELHGDLAARSGQLSVIKLRSFNFTGPGQDSAFVSSDFAKQIALIEKGESEAVIRVGNLSAVRDFSDVRDIARYVDNISAAYHPDTHEDRPVNLCSGRSCSIQEILDTLLSYSTKEIEVVVDKSKYRPIDTKALFCEPVILREKYDLIPQYTLESTLKDLLNYWRSRV